jgi:predicted acetyltransferase
MILSFWKDVFFDSEDFITQFINHFGIENCFVYEINHEMVAMAFALPVTLSSNSKFKTYSLQYMYACATHPNYRRQGIMEKLLAAVYDKACHENIDGLFLHAANQHVANYYRKLGFQDFFYQKCATFNRKERNVFSSLNRVGEASCAKNAMKCIAPQKYYNKRLQKLNDYCFINWNEDFFTFLSQNGTHFCEHEDTIFSYRFNENKIIIDECLGNATELQIANLLFEYIPDIKTVEICSMGNESCYGQIKWNKSIPINIRNAYFAFALE